MVISSLSVLIGGWFEAEIVEWVLKWLDRVPTSYSAVGKLRGPPPSFLE
jgi:hypothetical protein